MKNSLLIGVLIGVMVFSLTAITAYAQFRDAQVTSGLVNASVFELILEADMSVTSEDVPDPVAVGQQLTYRFEVTNNGPDDASGARLVDTIDPSSGFIFNSATATQGRCIDQDATVECRFGTMSSGATVTVEIVLTPTQESKPRNRVRVGSKEHDPDMTNNFAGERTTVIAVP